MRPKRNLTIYARDPTKNYAFVRIGNLGAWTPGYKQIWIDDKLYTLIQEG